MLARAASRPRRASAPTAHFEAEYVEQALRRNLDEAPALVPGRTRAEERAALRGKRGGVRGGGARVHLRNCEREDHHRQYADAEE